jgi:hypothetical protein
MKKGNRQLILLTTFSLVVLASFALMGPSNLFGYTGPILHGTGNKVELNDADARGNMLQFRSNGDVLGFQPGKAFFVGLDHALRIDFLGTSGVIPKSTAPARDAGDTSMVSPLGEVVYKDLWPGISLTYSSTRSGIAESSYHIAPGADVSTIRWRYNVPVETQSDGSLKLTFRSGFLTESAPVAWQEIGGKRVPVEVSFRTLDGELGFRVAKYDTRFPLTIDPTYVWHTFYGSINSNEYGFAIAVDGSGNVYVTGESDASWNGPSGQSPLHAFSGDVDIFVLKLNTNGSYQWHTFYGSSSSNIGNGIALDGSGNVYVTGVSYASWNGPLGQSPLHGFSGDIDIFVLKLGGSGSYHWHTFYGASSVNIGHGIALDGSGNVYVTGESYASWNGPSGQAPLHGFTSDFAVFVLKLNSSGTYQWHTFYSSANIVAGLGIALDGSGYVYVTGESDASWNGPTGQAAINGFSGFANLFVLKLDGSGTYQWHTFYGSASSTVGYGIAVDGSGNIFVSGESDASWNGPALQPPLHAYSGDFDVVILKLNSSGAYQWHTYYGSTSFDVGSAIAADGSGNVFVTGESDASWNGPSGQSPLNVFSGNSDIVILKLDSGGSYQWHTFYGISNDAGEGIAVDGSGNVYVAGESDVTWNGPSDQSPLHAFSGNEVYDIAVIKMTETSGAPGTLMVASSNPNSGQSFAYRQSGQTVWQGGSTPFSSGFAGGTQLEIALPFVAFSTGNNILSSVSGCDSVSYYRDDPAITNTVICSVTIDGDKSVSIQYSGVTVVSPPVTPSIFWENLATREVVEWTMDGATNTGQISVTTLPSGWDVVGVGDINKDGKQDFVLFNSTTGDIYIYYVDGGTILGGQAGGKVGGNEWKIMGVADLNGDGSPDYLWQNQFFGRLYVWYMGFNDWHGLISAGGDEISFGGGVTQPDPAVWEVVGTGDFNGDGHLDIVGQNKTTGNLILWYLNGTTVTGQAYIPGPGDLNWKVEGVGDYNKDGKPDILWRNQSNGFDIVWFMNNTTVTGSSALPSVTDPSWHIVGPK